MSRVCVLACMVAALAVMACGDKKSDDNKTEPSAAEKEKATRTKAIETEANMHLRKIFDESIAYYQSDLTPRGQDEIVPKQFPVSAEAPSDWKAKVCPEKGKPAKKYVADGDKWSADTWQALNFAIDSDHPFYNRYVYESTGTGTDATGSIKAISDPNCDGNEVVVELKFKVNDENEVVKVQ